MIIAAALSLALASAPQAQDTMLTQYAVNGLKVIHMRRPPTSDVVAVQLYLLGGSRQVTAANAGVEPLYLRASVFGTEKYPGEKTRRAMAVTGSSISASAESDWTSFEFHGVKSDFDSTWAVFADRLLHPTLDSVSVELIRARMLSAVARRTSSPEALASYLADSVAMIGHPYAIDPNGSEQSLRAITRASLIAYARESFVTSRMLLVVVGDVSRERVERLVSSTIGTLPAGSYTWSLPSPWKQEKATIAKADRRLPTNYFSAYMAGPARSSPEYRAFSRAMSLLGAVVSYEVREMSTLSYSAGVGVIERGAPSAVLYMSTTNPDSAMKLVNKAIKTLSSDVMIPRSALRRGAKSFTLAYVRESETSSGLADMLGRSALYDGDATAASRMGELMAGMDYPSMRGALRRYAKTLQVGFVGDTSRIPVTEFTKPQ
jgi:zinc protease